VVLVATSVLARAGWEPLVSQIVVRKTTLVVGNTTYQTATLAQIRSERRADSPPPPVKKNVLKFLASQLREGLTEFVRLILGILPLGSILVLLLPNEAEKMRRRLDHVLIAEFEDGRTHTLVRSSDPAPIADLEQRIVRLIEEGPSELGTVIPLPGAIELANSPATTSVHRLNS